MSDWPDFNTVNLPDLYKRLLLAAEGRLRRLRWRGEFSGAVPQGMQATDFVQTAFKKAKANERSWDSQRSLYQNLWQIVSSEISHATESYENKNVIRDDQKIINIQDYRENPEESVQYNKDVDRLMAYLRSNDPETAEVAFLIIRLEMTKSIEIGVHLKKSVREVENVKKRLRRLCRNYQEQQTSKTQNASNIKAPRRGES